MRERVVGVYLWLCRLFEGPTPLGQLTVDELAKSRRMPLLVFNLLFSTGLAWIITGHWTRHDTLPPMQVGDIAEQTIRSPVTADMEPRRTEARSRQDLGRRIAPVFDYEENATANWIQIWTQTFASIRNQFFKDNKKRSMAGELEQIGQTLQRQTGQKLEPDDLLFIAKHGFSQQLEDLFQEFAKPLQGRLISQTDLFASYYSTGILVRQVGFGLNETLVNDVSRIWSVDHARQWLAQVLATSPKRSDPTARRMLAVVQYLIPPNLIYNAEMTERRITEALGKKETTLISVKRGQVLIRMGERASEGQIEVLESIRLLTSPWANAVRFAATALIFLVFFGALLYLDLTRRSFLRLTLKNALVFAGITLLSVAAIKFFLPALKEVLVSMNIQSGAEYWMPVTASAILVHLLIGPEVALCFSMLLGISSALVVERDLYYGIWVFSVCTVALRALGACKQRTDLYKSGAWSGLMGAALVVAFHTIQSLGMQSSDWLGLAIRASACFVSGIGASIIASTLIPVVESVFGYTTNLKLLELSNFNHPLLHNLMMKAPGTYHHSIMVGSLAEIAADRIKANPLLARVSAYYHDIGKMVNPLYFIENQSGQYNPHDHLAPSISARILFSHVKNGARMGREHGLGESINDIIQQHHGTTLATFFYNKATASQETNTSESDYRYPGPRPQSREAAIVMIADACEAATRSIPDPTPNKIRNMVHNIITRRFLDQQFHDCDLSLRDLQTIEDCISQTLLSLYHQRIEYPGQRQSLEAQNS